MGSAAKPFRLSANLSGHSQDVRGVAFPKRDLVLSCSRDTTARVWLPGQPGANEWTAGTVYQSAHVGFVNCVGYIREGDEEYLVSAGQDMLIHLWPLHPSPSEPYRPRFTLIGHAANVCCLAVGGADGRTIVSGSWDSSAKVWRNHEVAYTLTGHANAVWAVLMLPPPPAGEGQGILTGAADNLIKLWRGKDEVLTFKGHTQAVRALASLATEPQVFASAGNDASVRLWTLGGQALHVFDGHDSFVYSLACLPTGELVSSGEDRSVRIWDPTSSGGGLKQTITIPAISVWAVAACAESGDLVCGSSDGQVRIFTREDSRLASEATLAAFEESVRASTVSSATIGDVKKSDLPGKDVLLQPGKKEGQVVMVKNESNGAVEAHQWDSAAGRWQMIGTVVDGVGSSRKQLYEGKEYDYVFDVDIKDGAPPLKLPYNASDNPYMVAQTWLARHDLPATYVDQIVEFIDKNTGGVGLGSTAGADPYTGASSYRPTGTSTGGDPWTSSATQNAPESLLPHKSYLTFTQTNLHAVRSKLSQFAGEIGDGALSESDIEAVDGLVAFLGKPSGNPPAASLVVLRRIVSDWPAEKQFPALDLFRLTCLHAVSADDLRLFTDVAMVPSAQPSKATEANGMLVLRALANSFASTHGKRVMAHAAKEILGALALGVEEGQNKNGRVALATILLNYSILALEGKIDFQPTSSQFDLADKLLQDDDGEVVYRSLVALGNLLVSTQVKSSLSTDEARRVRAAASRARKRLGEARIASLVAEIERL